MKKISADSLQEVLDLISEIKATKWFTGDGQLPDGVTTYLFSTRHDAEISARNAANAAGFRFLRFDELDADGLAAQNAIKNAIQYDAWEITRAIAGKPARGPMRDDAWAVLRDVAGDAALYAGLLLCGEAAIDQAHIDHIKRRWQVWQAGYGLCYDVGGVLYCYRKP